MSHYDQQFKRNINDILSKGTRYESRAIWEDTQERANCIKLFGLVNEYDLSKELPVGTLRKFPIYNCIDELFWIWLKKSNNIKDLSSHIWDSWTDANGTIGSAYGFQVANKYRKSSIETFQNGVTTSTPVYLDQMDFVLHELRTNPFSRRIHTNLYDVGSLSTMALEPCCYSCTWNVTKNDNGEKVLNMVLNQRSQDMIVANNWNIFQYSVLLLLVAQEVNMKPGKIVHVIADAHIYDRHIPIAEELLDRKEYDTPTLIFKKKPFYEYTCRDFVLENYISNPAITGIPVAV